MKRVMLICTSGLTSNILLARMRKIIFANNLTIDIQAFSTNQVQAELEISSYDAILLSPQVRYFKNELQELIGEVIVPIEVINMKDYGLMDAESILNHIQTLLEK